MRYAVTITRTYAVLVDASCEETALEIAGSMVGETEDNLEIGEALPIRIEQLPPVALPQD